jgi:hypothetical protein
MIYLHFLLNISKTDIYFLLMYVSIVVKMDNFHLFEVILKFLFHAWEVIDSEIYKQHYYFSYMYACVNVVVHFVMDLITMIHHKKHTCLQTI